MSMNVYGGVDNLIQHQFKNEAGPNKRRKISESDSSYHYNSSESTLHARSDNEPSFQMRKELGIKNVGSNFSYKMSEGAMQAMEPKRLYKPIPIQSLNVLSAQLLNY